MTARGTWKAFERRVSRMFGTERIPVTGERNGADAENAMFAFQMKLGRRMPAYLGEWLRGITGTAERKGKVGVVVWKPLYARDAEAVVVLRLKDFQDLHGRTYRGGPIHDGQD